MRKAQARMRQKLINLVDELHWQCARWLTSNYRVILLPKFETQSMTRRGEMQIQSKTARMMLSFQHYRFKKRLRWKAWQRGSLLLEVNEAYTSRTPQLGRESGREVGRLENHQGRVRFYHGPGYKWRPRDIPKGFGR